MSTLYLDGDIIAYQAATAAETPIDWGDGMWTLHAFEPEVFKIMDAFILKLKEESGIDKAVAVISDKKNYRKDVAPYYKENRKSVRRPMLLARAKEYLSEKYDGIVWPNLEADDVLGILGTSEDDAVIWSLDKDLMTIPTSHLIEGEVIQVTEEEADYKFFHQTLTGDTVDNYKGCPKVGPKTADKILKDSPNYWNSVVDAFEKAGLNEAMALENARLARILRTGEYNLETNEVSLWEP
jgi:DNA polymerase-1